jgi:two-component system, cell cycle response regulator
MSTDGPIRILLVEDSPAFAYLVAEFLAELDLRIDVEHCEMVGEAVALLAKRSFDLILLDQSLPDSSPDETLATIVSCAPECPVVVMSGSVPMTAIDGGALSAADGFLHKKDVAPESLLAAIQRSLNR